MPWRDTDTTRSGLAVSLVSPVVLSPGWTLVARAYPGGFHGLLRVVARRRQHHLPHALQESPSASLGLHAWLSGESVPLRTERVTPASSITAGCVSGWPAHSRVQLASTVAVGQRTGNFGRLAQSVLRAVRSGDLLLQKRS